MEAGYPRNGASFQPPPRTRLLRRETCLFSSQPRLLAPAEAELWKLWATRVASYLRQLHWSDREVIRPARKLQYRYASCCNCTFRAKYSALPLCCSVWIQRGIAGAPEAGSALFVGVVQVAIAVGSSVGGRIDDMAGGRADFTFGCALALLGSAALQRLAARERQRTKGPACRCSPSHD